jgi:hypothetical protein
VEIIIALMSWDRFVGRRTHNSRREENMERGNILWLLLVLVVGRI